ncbi:hypothetical protein [Rhizobium aegyptiacum]|nr:hypothetical protein [Rhizobium aegyptiacum]
MVARQLEAGGSSAIKDIQPGMKSCMADCDNILIGSHVNHEGACARA